MGHSYYRCCWHEFSNPLFIEYYHTGKPVFSPIKGLYVPKDFINHATSLRQACAHCGRFSTAATRRCIARVSVLSVGVSLSAPLGVIGLVGHYPTNYLIPRRPLKKRITPLPRRDYRELPTLSDSYARLLGAYLRITTSSATVLADRSTCMPYPRRQHSS